MTKNTPLKIMVCTDCAGKGKVKGKHYKKGRKCPTCDGHGELVVELTTKN